jgi:hypothetical protein
VLGVGGSVHVPHAGTDDIENGIELTDATARRVGQVLTQHHPLDKVAVANNCIFQVGDGSADDFALTSDDLAASQS